jgi:hypothetical protein
MPIKSFRSKNKESNNNEIWDMATAPFKHHRLNFNNMGYSSELPEAERRLMLDKSMERFGIIRIQKEMMKHRFRCKDYRNGIDHIHQEDLDYIMDSTHRFPAT